MNEYAATHEHHAQLSPEVGCLSPQLHRGLQTVSLWNGKDYCAECMKEHCPQVYEYSQCNNILQDIITPQDARILHLITLRYGLTQVVGAAAFWTISVLIALVIGSFGLWLGGGVVGCNGGRIRLLFSY